MPVASLLDGFNPAFLPLYIVCLTGSLSQVVLLVCLLKDPLKCFRNSATYFVGNLAVCDFGVSLLIVFGAFDSSSPLLRLMAYTTFNGTILTIFSISFDRYMMVAHPFKHRIVMSGKRAAVWIMVIWLLSVSIPLYDVITTRSTNEIGAYKYGILSGIIGLTTIMYVLTCMALKGQVKFLKGTNEERHGQRLRVAAEERFMRTVILITVIAVGCLTPVAIYAQVFPEQDSSNGVNYVYSSLMTLLCLNFAINPLIYFIRLKNYRKTILLVFCCRN